MARAPVTRHGHELFQLVGQRGRDDGSQGDVNATGRGEHKRAVGQRMALPSHGGEENPAPINPQLTTRHFQVPKNHERVVPQ